MIARANRVAWLERAPVSIRAAFVAAACSIATPASAEVGAAISAFSDYHFHGVSLSDGRPVANLDLSYDSNSGLYAGLSGTVVASRYRGIQPLRLAINGGYAIPVGREVTIDVGVLQTRYSRYSGLPFGRSYTEFYAGIAQKAVTARLSISPSYGGARHWTARGEIGAHKDLGSSLTLNGLLAASWSIGSPGALSYARPVWDGRIALAKRLGSVSLQAAVTARGKTSDFDYPTQRHRRVALIVGVSKAL